MAGALSQVVQRAKIAVLGPTLPILNPVRVAEEFAMLDTMSGGRLVAGMMRGTPNEYVTYNFNPSESRARFAEALGSDPPRLDRAAAFRLAGPLLPVSLDLDLAAAGAAAASADLHVGLEPRGRRVRGAQPYRPRFCLHDHAARAKTAVQHYRACAASGLGADAGRRHLSRRLPCRRHRRSRLLPT